MGANTVLLLSGQGKETHNGLSKEKKKKKKKSAGTTSLADTQMTVMLNLLEMVMWTERIIFSKSNKQTYKQTLTVPNFKTVTRQTVLSFHDVVPSNSIAINQQSFTSKRFVALS